MCKKRSFAKIAQFTFFTAWLSEKLTVEEFNNQK